MKQKRKKNNLIPSIKKKVNAFLVGEEGKISKKSLLKVGGVLTGLASMGLAQAGVSRNGVFEEGYIYDGNVATVKHINMHSSHAQHSSHSSY